MKDGSSGFVWAMRPASAMSFVPILAAAFFLSTLAARALPPPNTSATACIFCDPLNTVFDPHFAKVGGGPNDDRLIEAAASFGSVGVEDTINEGNFSGGPVNFGVSEGFFEDVLTIAGVGTGKISFNVGLEGSATTTLPGIVDPQLQFTFGASAIHGGVFAGGTNIHVASVIDGYPSKTFTSTSFNYTFGDPIIIFMDMTGALGASTHGSGPLIAKLLYINTAILNGITVLDANGALVTNINVTSASGTFYDANGVGHAPTGVPEPPTLALMAVALASFGFLLRRRRES